MKFTSKQIDAGVLILQILLALYNLAGGLYMMGNYKNIAHIWLTNSLPQIFWIVFGLLQILLSIGLLLPRKKETFPQLPSFAAVGLGIMSILGILLYDTYTAFPGLLWGVIPALLLFFIAYSRWQH